MKTKGNLASEWVFDINFDKWNNDKDAPGEHFESFVAGYDAGIKNFFDQLLYDFMEWYAAGSEEIFEYPNLSIKEIITKYKEECKSK